MTCDDGDYPGASVEEGDEHSQLVGPIVSLPLIITKDMRRTLIEDLNYSRQDVNNLKPEEAMEIIQKGIRNNSKVFSRPGTTALNDNREALDSAVLDTLPPALPMVANRE